MLLCDFILNSLREPPGEQLIYHTLLQLCLVERLSDEQDLDEAAVQASQDSRRCAGACRAPAAGLQASDSRADRSCMHGV